MKQEFSLDEIQEVAKSLLDQSPENKIYLFEGPLGAGKTTLIKALCRQLGINHDMSSPSFGIINAYLGDGAAVYHFDLYRLQDPMEAFDLGIEEYLSSGKYCFIEWPQIAMDIFKSFAFKTVKLEIIDKEKRSIFVEE